MNQFIMVTPARDEEKLLPKVIESVAKSSFRPVLWIIVDDNSTDETGNIIEEASKEYGYIKLLRLNDGSDRNFIHYCQVCQIGFDYAIRFFQENEIKWKFIVLLDADTIVERRYFEGVIGKMQEHPKIGIASGEIYVLTNGKIKNDKRLNDRPSGTARIWRKNCFYETEGYCISQSPDSVSTAKARMKGWKTARFPEPRAFQLRETSSVEGLWKGYVVRGKGTYHLGCHPFLVLARALSYAIQPRFYLVIPYFIGYLESAIRKRPKIQDEEIVKYFKKELLNESLGKWQDYLLQLIRGT